MGHDHPTQVAGAVGTAHHNIFLARHDVTPLTRFSQFRLYALAAMDFGACRKVVGKRSTGLSDFLIRPQVMTMTPLFVLAGGVTDAVSAPTSPKTLVPTRVRSDWVAVDVFGDGGAHHFR
jgi:hypothetical protein